MRKSPLVSVVVRTLNESAVIGRCLESLRAQPAGNDLDVVVVDSGSTDDTLEIAREFSPRITKIPPETFDYSRALNVGIEAAAGELIVILSADAAPREADWLERITAPFDDEEVAGVYCRQVPWPDANWHEVARIGRMFPDVPKVFTQANLEELTVFSNSASCIRRSVWERFPFTLPAVEDLDWAQRVVRAGWTIVYEPSASVSHSHQESAARQARRLIDITKAHDIAEGTNRTLALTARQGAGLLYRDLRAITRLDEPQGRKLRYALTSLAVASRFVVGLGSRRGATHAKQPYGSTEQ